MNKFTFVIVRKSNPATEEKAFSIINLIRRSKRDGIPFKCNIINISNINYGKSIDLETTANEMEINSLIKIVKDLQEPYSKDQHFTYHIIFNNNNLN